MRYYFKFFAIFDNSYLKWFNDGDDKSVFAVYLPLSNLISYNAKIIENEKTFTLPVFNYQLSISNYQLFRTIHQTP